MRVVVLLLAVLLAGCTNPPDKVVQYDVPVGPDRFRDEHHGKEIWFAIGPINPVGRMPANGMAQAQYFENGTYRLSVELNVRPAAEGTFYEAWLLSDDGEMQNIGELEQVARDERHVVQQEEQADLRQSTTLLITRQTVGGDPSPGQTIASGVLAHYAR